MKVLVLGGTRFFGIHMVHDMIDKGYEVTLATRGRTKDPFGENVSRVIVDRSDEESMIHAFSNMHFDVVIDKIAYCSNDIKYSTNSISCDRYIHMSSTAVYEPLQVNTSEKDFDVNKEIIWCDRSEGSYAEVKRQAEYSLWKSRYQNSAVAMRCPFVVGTDDYTNRLKFYVEHVINEIPMYIDNLECQISFISSDEAGKLLSFMVESPYVGAINGCSSGTISIKEILDYVEERTGKAVKISSSGEEAPYNGTKENSINTQLAQELGFKFTNLREWIFKLLDYYIEN